MVPLYGLFSPIEWPTASISEAYLIIEGIPVFELTHLEIIGPDETAENSAVQYKAIAYYDNNSTSEVTNSADWSVEPNVLASVSAGLLTTEMIDLPTDVTITAAPAKTAVVLWSDTSEQQYWGSAAGAFYRRIERQ